MYLPLLIRASEKFLVCDQEGGVQDALAALSLATGQSDAEGIAICCVTLGDHYQHQARDPHTAVQYYLRCLSFQPAVVEAHEALAACYRELNQVAKAEEHVEAARRLRNQPDITLSDWMKVSPFRPR